MVGVVGSSPIAPTNIPNRNQGAWRFRRPLFHCGVSLGAMDEIANKLKIELEPDSHYIVRAYDKRARRCPAPASLHRPDRARRRVARLAALVGRRAVAARAAQRAARGR